MLYYININHFTNGLPPSWGNKVVVGVISAKISGIVQYSYLTDNISELREKVEVILDGWRGRDNIILDISAFRRFLKKINKV